ncbi:MAG: outer membrane lipid asymmetry maintenance protein MlaD [Rhodobacteraceae bacterium]|nr:outer membrane lipid asymmetry maintenance protein MlaD [Paracoccaceae bacterium]
MIGSKTEVFVGGIVVVIAIAFSVYISKSLSMSGVKANYPIYASFRSAEGISVGTDVRLAGVTVGSVTHLELDSHTYQAKSTLSISKEILIPDDSTLSIASEGLLGGNFVEVLPGASFDYLEAGDEVLDTQGSVSLIQLMMRFVTGSSE